MESPVIIPLTRVLDEARGITTFLFNHNFERKPKPGQFVMVWLPGVDEIPLALSHISIDETGEHGVTVAKVGDATGKFHELGKNDVIGVRGPYGTGFKFGRSKRILVVGGGIGMAPIAPAVEAAREEGRKVEVALGAQSAEDLLFAERMRHSGIEPMLCTDDGTAGEKCLVTVLAEKMLERTDFELVLACGPEVMLKKIVELCSARDTAVQLSLERYMKCGVGICDSCAIDGLHVCTDGPVFTGEQLAQVKDFGKWKRDPSGKKVAI